MKSTELAGALEARKYALDEFPLEGHSGENVIYGIFLFRCTSRRACADELWVAFARDPSRI